MEIMLIINKKASVGEGKIKNVQNAKKIGAKGRICDIL